MLPPNRAGTITYLARNGDYNIDVRHCGYNNIMGTVVSDYSQAMPKQLPDVMHNA